jgi:hypothetical protein
LTWPVRAEPHPRKRSVGGVEGALGPAALRGDSMSACYARSPATTASSPPSRPPSK